MTTILGQHISLIRPKLISKPIISKNDRPRSTPKYLRAKEIKEHSGKVTYVAIKLFNGVIFKLRVPSTHLSVALTAGINLDDVAANGWELENGNLIWR